MSEPVTRRYPSSDAPAGHHKIKPWVLYAGGGALVVGVYFFVIRPRRAAATAVTDTTGTDTTGVDSSLGYADPSGYGGGYGSGSPSLGGYYDPSTGTFIPTGGRSIVTVPTTNSAWAQQATAYLVQAGYNPIAVLNALGRYITSTHSISVTQPELHIIQAAIASEGYPPIKPPEPHLQPHGGQTKQTKVVRTAQAGTIHEIAAQHSMEIRGFVKLNPRLAARYLNTGKKIPKGTVITVYV